MEDGDFSQNRRLDLAVWPAAFIFADFFVFSGICVVVFRSILYLLMFAGVCNERSGLQKACLL